MDLRRDFVFGLFLFLGPGFGGVRAGSSASRSDNDWDERGELPAVRTPATRESRICCASSLVESGLVESGAGAEDATLSGSSSSGSSSSDSSSGDSAGNSSGSSRAAGSSETGIEAGASDGAGAWGAAICAARGCHSRSCCAAWTSWAKVRTSMLGFCRVVRAKRSSRYFGKRLIFFLPAQGSIRGTKKPLYGRMGTRKIGTGGVQH